MAISHIWLHSNSIKVFLFSSVSFSSFSFVHHLTLFIVEEKLIKLSFLPFSRSFSFFSFPPFYILLVLSCVNFCIASLQNKKMKRWKIVFSFLSNKIFSVTRWLEFVHYDNKLWKARMNELWGCGREFCGFWRWKWWKKNKEKSLFWEQIS